MKVFYHLDADGICAAFMIHVYESRNIFPALVDAHENCKNDNQFAFLPAHLLYTESDFRKINYGWKFPFKDISKYERVYIVDFSLEPEDLEKLMEITTDIIWIDHHKSAVLKYRKYKETHPDFNYENIKGIRIPFNTDAEGDVFGNIAGCMLTYLWTESINVEELVHCEDPEYGINFINTKIKEAPKFVQYIADQDVWRFDLGVSTMLFNAALKRYAIDPFCSVFTELYRAYCLARKTSSKKDRDYENSLYEEYLKEGDIINSYIYNHNAEFCAAKSYKAELNSDAIEYMATDDIIIEKATKTIIRAINAVPGFNNSSVFDSIDKSEYDLLIIYGFDGLKFNYTAYQGGRNKGLSPRELAEAFGGGGHEAAAGFKSDKFILYRENPNIPAITG